MADPTSIVLTQAPDRFRDAMALVQLLATVLLAIVAIYQMRAANRQAEAANTQAAAAKAQLDNALKPRLVFGEWRAIDGGGMLHLRNEGQGTAFALQWRFEDEFNWVRAEDAVSSGDESRITVMHSNLNRLIVISYHSKGLAEYITTVSPTAEHPKTTNKEPGSDDIIAGLRQRQGQH
jgi:hypothetical protein